MFERRPYRWLVATHKVQNEIFLFEFLSLSVIFFFFCIFTLTFFFFLALSWTWHHSTQTACVWRLCCAPCVKPTVPPSSVHGILANTRVCCLSCCCVTAPTLGSFILSMWSPAEWFPVPHPIHSHFLLNFLPGGGEELKCPSFICDRKGPPLFINATDVRESLNRLPVLRKIDIAIQRSVSLSFSKHFFFKIFWMMKSSKKKKKKFQLNF